MITDNINTPSCDARAINSNIMNAICITRRDTLYKKKG